MATNEGCEREDAAFAVVIRAKNEGDVLQGDNKNESPNDAGNDAKNILFRQRNLAVSNGEDGAHDIEGTGADIAKNDTEGT